MATTLPEPAGILALCSLVLLGLVCCGGGGAEVKSETSTTTTGQQLIDLKRALDAGAITREENEQERKKILDKR